MKSINGINFVNELSKVKEYWSPKVIGQVNNQYIKVAKLKGQFLWHKHDHEDEMFFVVYGTLRIELQDGVVTLEEGEFFVVPKNTMHNPIADEECGIVLIETESTLHTGNVDSPLTKTIEEQLSN
ncbi:cupin domain-containing protein [Risungbinella massiliensis]|uniref:cupin domain-containing protein n=1 Tax=Risungbinella massiliensis TaxID=1329796 RepID=UPI001E4CBAB2|nr:cupin domain-containing protein [Risungbinella massiliensis]